MLRTGLWMLLLVTIACDRRDAASPPPPPRPLTILASTYPLADLAREVGGDHVRVDWLIDLGDPLADFVPTQAERERMIAHEMILLDSPRRTEGWAAAELGRMQATGRMVTLEELPVVRTLPPAGLLQLDPVAARDLVNLLADRFSQRMPEQHGYFAERAAGLVARIDAIVAANPKSVFGPGRVVVLGDQFRPLLDRFGIGYDRIDADPLRMRGADIELVRIKSAESGARALVVPFDTPPGALADLQARTGLRLVTLDPLGFPNYEGHGSYTAVLAYNVQQLRAASAP